MIQYLELLKTIQEKGVNKPPAREEMPGSKSLFGYQFRHNLQDGFPLLTTKKMFWKGVVVELLWFLRGDTNIKYLVDNGVNIWNEDAYNYYLKQCKNLNENVILTFEEFIRIIKQGKTDEDFYLNDKWFSNGYKLGDCGYQYGKVWRNWETKDKYWDEEPSPLEGDVIFPDGSEFKKGYMYRKSHYKTIDQIKNLIEGLQKNPESRRHIVTAIDPAHDTHLALYWCHAMFQFNCRPLSNLERCAYSKGELDVDSSTSLDFDKSDVPKYYLDCQLYQRSADAVLGVPFNIASYALLTHILAKICNMIPGEFIHTFGDVHIYDNHKEAVEEQLKRTPYKLPTLKITNDLQDLYFNGLDYKDFELENYNPQPAIKAELSTGLKK